ncbi:hypothetical protein [Brevibacillus fulvus]|uniref:Uncharacterized protein n=1 Tax=Brevibacillus fulvus TaxID=1125967 RepID=A0A938XSC2_9BACL|nr:hypothetical protein [Brevibacillus fulvus]MBM7589478.1 hypothetical protein [Brevibacillus fulvus]
MKAKLLLTEEEVKLYKEYKRQILSARTRNEIYALQKKALSILETGKARYVQRLEQQEI